jgi:hypothetical protein
LVFGFRQLPLVAWFEVFRSFCDLGMAFVQVATSFIVSLSGIESARGCLQTGLWSLSGPVQTPIGRACFHHFSLLALGVPGRGPGVADGPGEVGWDRARGEAAGFYVLSDAPKLTIGFIIFEAPDSDYKALRTGDTDNNIETTLPVWRLQVLEFLLFKMGSWHEHRVGEELWLSAGRYRSQLGRLDFEPETRIAQDLLYHLLW